VKGVFVVSPEAGETAVEPERRKQQRRMGLPRRVVVDRRGEDVGISDERRDGGSRRASGSRRRRPDRRIGLSKDLDLFLLGI